LEVEVARSGSAHGQATSVLDAMPARRKLLTTRRVSAAGIGLVLAAVTAALVIAALTGPDRRGQANGAPSSGPIAITGQQAFDPPPGDGEEHSEDVGLATDGNPGTGWSTETYDAPTTEAAVSKPGVGLILDVGKPVAARTLTVSSSDPGWGMQVFGAASGPPSTLKDWGSPIGEDSDMETDQQVELDATSASRYYLIWIPKLAQTGTGYSVQINEVGLLG